MPLPGASEAVALDQSAQLFVRWAKSPLGPPKPDLASFQAGFLAAVRELEPVMARMSLRRNMQNWVSEDAAIRLVCAALRYDPSTDVELSQGILALLVRFGVIERLEDQYRWREQ